MQQHSTDFIHSLKSRCLKSVMVGCCAVTLARQSGPHMKCESRKMQKAKYLYSKHAGVFVICPCLLSALPLHPLSIHIPHLWAHKLLSLCHFSVRKREKSTIWITNLHMHLFYTASYTTANQFLQNKQILHSVSCMRTSDLWILMAK